MSLQPYNPPTVSGEVLPPSALQSMAELKSTFLVFSDALDLTPVKFKLIKEKGWDIERANRVEPQYKAFLFLMGTKSSQMFVPTLDIDEMWHAHILDTRKYMADCAVNFGEYIHHYPYLGLKDGEDEVRARQLFTSTCSIIFDAFDVDVSSVKFSCCGGGGGCGGGGSSCGGGGSSCGGGHASCGGHHASCSSVVPASCGGSNTPSKTDDETRKPTRPSEPARQEEKRGVFRRILGLSPQTDGSDWYASVTPELFSTTEFRPDDAALRNLCARESYH